MLSPYRKLAKSSLNRAKLSCMSWKCIMLASRSVTASASSAKAGSKALSGNGSPPPFVLRCADSRKDDRDEGRSGVVGREREVERGLRASSGLGPDIVSGCRLRRTWSHGLRQSCFLRKPRKLLDTHQTVVSSGNVLLLCLNCCEDGTGRGASSSSPPHIGVANTPRRHHHQSRSSCGRGEQGQAN